MTEEKKRLRSIIIGETKYYTNLTQKFENRKVWEAPNINEVKSYIPGKIIKIAVKEGQKVKVGDALFTLEAMKMRNKVVAHKAGQIKKIYVIKDENVPKDKLIIEFK